MPPREGKNFSPNLNRRVADDFFVLRGRRVIFAVTRRRPFPNVRVSIKNFFHRDAEGSYFSLSRQRKVCKERASSPRTSRHAQYAGGRTSCAASRARYDCKIKTPDSGRREIKILISIPVARRSNGDCQSSSSPDFGS